MITVYFPLRIELDGLGTMASEHKVYRFIDSLPLMEDGSEPVQLLADSVSLLFKNDEDALIFKLRFGL